MVDYHTLLKKYIVHVGMCEGIDFISNDWCPEGFTETEWEQLVAVSKETWDEFQPEDKS